MAGVATTNKPWVTKYYCDDPKLGETIAPTRWKSEEAVLNKRREPVYHAAMLNESTEDDRCEPGHVCCPAAFGVAS